MRKSTLSIHQICDSRVDIRAGRVTNHLFQGVSKIFQTWFRLFQNSSRHTENMSRLFKTSLRDPFATIRNLAEAFSYFSTIFQDSVRVRLFKTRSTLCKILYKTLFRLAKIIWRLFYVHFRFFWIWPRICETHSDGFKFFRDSSQNWVMRMSTPFDVLNCYFYGWTFMLKDW